MARTRRPNEEVVVDGQGSGEKIRKTWWISNAPEVCNTGSLGRPSHPPAAFLAAHP